MFHYVTKLDHNQPMLRRFWSINVTLRRTVRYKWGYFSTDKCQYKCTIQVQIGSMRICLMWRSRDCPRYQRRNFPAHSLNSLYWTKTKTKGKHCAKSLLTVGVSYSCLTGQQSTTAALHWLKNPATVQIIGYATTKTTNRTSWSYRSSHWKSMDNIRLTKFTNAFLMKRYLNL